MTERGEIMKVKCDICKTEIEEDEAMKEGEAVFCEECYMEKIRKRC